jgi:RNA polymerase sigma-54 factor
MAQEQKFTQEQRLEQQQKLTQTITHQQLLQAVLTELPIAQLQERINAEMDDNPALEISSDDPIDNLDSLDPLDNSDSQDNPDTTDTFEKEERQSALDAALESLGRDDEDLPVYHSGQSSQEEREEIVYGQTISFIDLLTEQMNMANLTERERDVMEYLIGSLDDDGLLRKPLDTISDELAIYHNIDVTAKEVEHVLHELQQFDPAGIGARTLQECLLLQVERREPSQLKTLMEKALKLYFDRFTKKHWKALQQGLKLNDLQTEVLIAELRKLNPKPGASISETVGRSLQQITPDFIVDTHSDGTVTFSLNTGDVPELAISPSFVEALKDYQSGKQPQTMQMKEAMVYTKRKLEAAASFIDAIRTRHQTLTNTMKAIIQWQHRFFEDGDEASLRPMILKDIAERTGYDLSTISRVSKSKYVQTRWGTFPLRYFFSDSYVTEDGEELSTREIKVALRDLIEHEDKRKPLSDEALMNRLAELGYPIARRTVAKYREQLGLPVARLRK